MKPVRVILSDEAEEAYNELNARAANSKIERSILKSIDFLGFFGKPLENVLYS